MKHLNTYITEYIIKKKLDKPIDSENYYNYTPKSRKELINNIKELLSKLDNIQNLYTEYCKYNSATHLGKPS